MYSLSGEDLKALIEKQTGLCVSMFMPTYRTGTESQQNPIRFRNLIRKAEDKLQAFNLRSQEIKALLEPVQELAGNVLSWRRQSDGLAIFLSGSLLRLYCLPILFNELIFVGDRFHIKPLLPLFHGEERLYILALSQNSVRLLEGTKYSVKEMEVEGVPKSMSDALSYEEPEKQIRFRTGKPSGGDRGAMLSGHGADIEDSKDNILKYFRQIDRGLHNFLKDERAPLVLAGVDYLFPIYKDANTYPYLMDDGISGNPEGISAEHLRRQAWLIVNPHFRKAENDALAQYRQSSGTGLTSDDIKEIVTAAYHGRVGLLFVAIGCHQWGIVSPEQNEIILQQEAGSGSDDLLDIASIQTFLNGGKVFAIPQEKMPGNRLSAAVLRY
ncbi:MAG TPA: hypothetical protein VJZ49_10935 [Syntrophales bacterium]|nr:hypothetical protein [Syntrophales bacterium]